MKMLGIFFASDNEEKLNEMTIHRTTASLPFGGRYRMIDFQLSNCVNSGITTIGVITKNNYSSLMDHIRMGREWDLNRKNSGITVFPPFVVNTAKEVFKGKVDALYSMFDYIKSNREEYVFITNSNLALNMDIREMYQQHIDTGADITVLSNRKNGNTGKRMILNSGKDKRVTEILIKDTYSDEKELVSLNAYIMHKDVLCGLVETSYIRGNMDFEADILQKKVGMLNIYHYEFKGYAAMISDIKSYYRESMALLSPDIRNELFYKHGKIYTKIKDSSPTIYNEGCSVSNSLIADGCIINGTVENSILFRGVKVGKGAVIKNSIVMENGEIMEKAQLAYAITDKSVTVRPGRVISGFETYPLIIVKGKTV